MKMRMDRNGGAALSADEFSRANGGAPATIGALLGDVAAMIDVWRWRRRERRHIRHLDDHMLRDIGLNRVVAEQIGARPFWKK